MTGDIIQYGADPSGNTDSTAAFNAALAASNTIFTSTPGVFKIGEISLSRPPGKFLTINMDGSELRNISGQTMFLSDTGATHVSIKAKRIRIQSGKVFDVTTTLSHLVLNVEIVTLVGQSDSLLNQSNVGSIGNCRFNISYITCKANCTESPIKFVQKTGQFFTNTFDIGFFQQTGDRATNGEYLPMIDIQTTNGVFYGNKYSVRVWEKTYRGAINLIGDANGQITAGNFHDQRVYAPIEHDSIRATTRCRRTKISNQQRTLHTDGNGQPIMPQGIYDINVDGSHLAILDNCGPTLPIGTEFKIKKDNGTSTNPGTSIRDCENAIID